MPHIDSNRRKPARRIPAAAVLLVLLLACLGLAACGGSSSSSSTSASASATTASTGAAGTGATGAGASRFKALRECLQQNGITLPQRTTGQNRHRPGGPGGAGGFLGGGAGAGGPKLPSGVTRAQYQAAIKKCGGGAFPGGAAARLKNPTYLAALTKFAACMRKNGVNVPTPNTSGGGPIFDTKGINTASSQFRTAGSKCRSDLLGAFLRGGAAGAGAGAQAGGGTSGATPGATPAG
jgi:hypothetical protein